MAPWHCRQRGYVLLLTLLVLMLAATAMAAVARRSFNRALLAQRTGEALQRRWGVLSCQRTLLPNVEGILSGAERATARTLVGVRRTVTLGGQEFELVLSDEQAKLNANALLRQRGRTEAERVLHEVLRASGSRTRVRLSGDRRRSAPAPLGGLVIDDPDDRPLQSLSQMFPAASPAALLGGPATGSATTDVTCWGSGELNYRRASATALRQFCAPAVDAIEMRKLLSMREKSPDVRASDALDRLQLDDDVRDSLDLRLVEGSSCHSLWIVARTRQRAWYHLFVLDRSVPEHLPRTVSFVW